jgi:lipoprotein-anchoring transpeptidase ErfK/SrfK
MSTQPVNRIFPWSWLIGGLCGLSLGILVYWLAVPLDIKIADTNLGDPNKAISLTSTGFLSQLETVEIKDDHGQIVPGLLEADHFITKQPLDYGKRYTVSARANRPFAQEGVTRNFVFTTAYIPKLLSRAPYQLEPDGALRLRFDRPVGSVQVKSSLALVPKADGQKVTLQSGKYRQGATYPVQFTWTTANGVSLPSFSLSVQTPEALQATVNVKGLGRVGVALPVVLTFSEPLQNREAVLETLKPPTIDGAPSSGKWHWIAKREVEFLPQPQWPAFAKVDVQIDPTGLKSVKGGWMEQSITQSFTTGPDRHIDVFLDTQRVKAIESGEVVHSFAISSGKSKTPTVTGKFYIYARYRRKTMTSSAAPGTPGYYKVENVPYAQYFYDGYAFHGAWWHSGFGHPMSHGCVNLSTRAFNQRWPNAREDAGWLWKWAAIGVPVTVYAHGG